MNESEKPEGSAESSPRHEDWSKLLAWVEIQAIDSLKARFTTAEILAKECQTTLTVLLAGVGGSAAYGASIFGPGSATAVGIASAVSCSYLVVLSVLLVLFCMRFTSYPAQFQEPDNLLIEGYSLDEIREAELKNLQDRIAEATKINSTKANRLNKVRIATALAPIIFVASAYLAPSDEKPEPEKLKIVCSSPSSTPSASVELVCNVER